MKRYNNLYPKIMDMANIELAHNNAQKGKRHYPAVLRVNRNPSDYLQRLHAMFDNQTYTTSEYQTFTKIGPKKNRVIYKLPYFPDRIAHHCIVQVLEPIWHKTFIRDTYSAIRGRGIHDGVRRMKKFLSDKENVQYCLKIDINKFYPSIEHSVMQKIIAMKIKCKNTLQLLHEIISSGSGLPIGNYLSQYFGNLILTPLDHWAKEILGVKYYSRYCDDIVILGRKKEWLHDVRKQISEYLHKNLSLQIKSNWRVFPTLKCGLDYLGYVFFGSHVRVRKEIVSAFKAKIDNIKKNYIRMDAIKIVSTIMSYYGWLRQADAYNLWSTHVDDTVRGIVSYVCYMNKTKNPLRGIAW